MRLSTFTAPALALASLLAFTASDSSAAISSASRQYVSGNYVLYVGNEAAGRVKEISGGGGSAQVVSERAGTTGQYPKKHVGAPQYDDITLSVGEPTKPLADWIKATINTASPAPKPGAFANLDFNGKEASRTSWTNGFISDVTFPELDGASKDPAYIAVTITPERTIFTSTPGGAVAPAAPKAAGKQPLQSSYRMSLTGIDMSKVSHVEPLGVRFKTQTSTVGELRDYEKTPGKVDVSNLVFTIAESAAGPLYKWFDDFVVKGQNSDDKERTATIEALSPNMATVLYKVTLNHVGIVRISPDKASTEQIRRVRVECYVESVNVDFPGI